MAELSNLVTCYFLPVSNQQALHHITASNQGKWRPTHLAATPNSIESCLLGGTEQHPWFNPSNTITRLANQSLSGPKQGNIFIPFTFGHLSNQSEFEQLLLSFQPQLQLVRSSCSSRTMTLCVHDLTLIQRDDAVTRAGFVKRNVNHAEALSANLLISGELLIYNFVSKELEIAGLSQPAVEWGGAYRVFSLCNM